jgi:hypothetical protein
LLYNEACLDERMTRHGWLDKPQEWRAIPNAEGKRRVKGKPSVKHQLDMIVKAGATRRMFLLRRERLEERTKLKNAAGGYRRTYAKAGFTFGVRKLPGEDAVGLWTVWQPADARPSA